MIDVVFDEIADKLGLWGEVRRACRMRQVNQATNSAIERELRRDRKGFRLSTIQQEIEAAEVRIAELLAYKPRGKAVGRHLLAAMRGPRRPNPSPPVMRLCPYTGEYRAVALRSPIVSVEDIGEPIPWRTCLPRSGAECLAVLMDGGM